MVTIEAGHVDGAEPPRSNALHAGFLARLPVDGASVSMVTVAGNQSTVSSSDALATRLEQLQYDLGEGPHYRALELQKPVLVPDVEAADHSVWPMFGHAVVDTDAKALFSFPMRIGAATVGVVDLYRLSPGLLSDRDVAQATALAGAAAGRAAAYAAADADGDGRHDSALVGGTRRHVHQATGMIAVQLDTSVTDAFARLRGYAYVVGRSVDDIARDVVAQTLDFTEPTG
ncbi:GAF and ANTAR domain-containing protein [Herbiconiux sp. CPCC 203407]|uniref:GAF and ANTAR domain-containing protein n=1 Tax=Herbiconiux oxytropis TaxID=2970915 RepID=A0AA42BRY4_9MICO|nr:GAF and ANTAR domain-containing protein [Herbiconiux oxytropis]MCS5721033.1 GAF and ANTAR domain-containing protein [Herbiconiux oxytropis]MCS5724685.1 GAF and ANTAR domain-containing protein [Herbiconiux oxytropis]